MGGYTNGGLKIMIYPKFHFGPKSGPKASFGVKIGGTDAENHEESKNNLKNFRKFTKKTKESPTIQRFLRKKTSFLGPPLVWTPIKGSPTK